MTTGPGADVTIVFDGGAIGNPGDGYGSYVVAGVIRTPQPVRVTFPGKTTNNQAEYLTLIEALRAVVAGLEHRGQTPMQVSIEIRSDSKLVVEQVQGRWKIRNAELRPRVREAHELLAHFGRWSLIWHPRTESVKILGH